MQSHGILSIKSKQNKPRAYQVDYGVCAQSPNDSLVTHTT